jgi:predicted alpha/beta hydrolase
MNAPLVHSQLLTESLWVDVGQPIQRLHLKRFYQYTTGTPVFLLHGSVSSGRVFYSHSMKGLAPFLARLGFDVYVADLSGRGESTPPVSRQSTRTQQQILTEEIPAFLQKIRELRGQNSPIHAIAHSWGGVLLTAYLARFPTAQFSSMVFLGSKRHVSVINRQRVLGLDLMWGLVGGLYTRLYGYLPAKQLRLGSDDEPAAVYRDCKKWVYSRHTWQDASDGFDYLIALQRAKNLPPTLHFAGQNDTFLGHPTDVQQLMHDMHNPADRFVLLSKANGFQQDYDHLSMCIEASAEHDHFRLIHDWIQSHAD